MYDHGDTGCITPLMKMFTVGHGFVPDPIHAGGLRYHGMAPMLSMLAKERLIAPRAYPQVEAMDAAHLFTRAEGLLPAPETAHALKAVIDEAVKCRETGEEKTILMLFSGHGFFDMSAYEAYLKGQLTPFELPEKRISETLGQLKQKYSF